MLNEINLIRPPTIRLIAGLDDFLANSDTEYSDNLCYTEIRWYGV